MQCLRALGRCALVNAWDAAVAQLVERVLGKDEVTGSNPVSSFRCDSRSGTLAGGSMYWLTQCPGAAG